MKSRIRVLGISGSPRKGNSQFLLDYAMKRVEVLLGTQVETDTYSFRGKRMGPCLGCGHCERLQGECVIKDHFQDLRDKWLWADAIIYSVPVYHMSMPGQLKCFIDRLGNSLFWRYSHRFEEGKAALCKQMKVIGCIVQGMHMASGQEHTLTDLINHALIMQCIPVTGDMWEAYIGAGGWTSNDEDRRALEEQFGSDHFDGAQMKASVESLVKRLVQLTKIIRAGSIAHYDELKADGVYLPLIDRLDEIAD